MDAKEGARQAFGAVQDQLLELSHRIHACPELGFEEERASTWLEEMLADAGFAVQAGAFELPTAFVARRGNGPIHVAIHKNKIWLLFLKCFETRLMYACLLLLIYSAVDPEIDLRDRNTKFLKKDIREERIMVLPRVDDHMFMWE